MRRCICAVVRSSLHFLLDDSLLAGGNGVQIVLERQLRIAQLAVSSAGVSARVCRRNEGRHLQATNIARDRYPDAAAAVLNVCCAATIVVNTQEDKVTR